MTLRHFASHSQDRLLLQHLNSTPSLFPDQTVKYNEALYTHSPVFTHRVDIVLNVDHADEVLNQVGCMDTDASYVCGERDSEIK